MKNDMSTTRHPAAEIRRACPATPAPETKAHSTLERGEHYYRALIENAPDMIVVLNGDGTIQYTSPSAERLHGYRAEDMIGKNGFDMIHPDDMIGCLEAYTLMIDTPNAKISRQLRLKSREGSWRHVEITAKNLLHDPVVNGIVINHRDITERKQAETELRESEEKYRLLMDNSGIPVTYFSLSGHVLLINKIGAKNLGGVPEDFVGKSISEILPQMADRMLEMNERIIASGIGEEHEDLIALPAGHRWFRSSIQPVKDAEGRVLAIQIVSPDITERKQVEEWTRVQRDLTHKLSAITRLDQALALCVTTAITATGMDCGGAYVADRETGGLDLVYPIGLSPDSVASVSHYSADCPNTRLVMAAKPTYALVSELNLPPDDSFRREALRVIAVIPITHEGEVIACLNVGSHTLDAIPVTSRNMIESIAAQIGGTIARLKAEEELREYRDHLEDLVRERTMDLTTANEALGEEILERNRTEKALKESETHYRLLADNVTDVIWVRDMHLKPTYVSPSVRDLLGYSVEEAMSQTIEEIVCPSSLETVTRTLAEALVKETTRKRQTLKSRTIEAELKRKNGSTIWAEITTSFLRNEKGQPIGIIGVTHDITERKQAEEALRQSERKLRTIFENVNDEIVYVDETGKVIEVNKRLKDIFGYEPHEVIGKGFMDFPFLDPGDMKQIVDAFTALTDGSGSSLTSFKATRKDGSMVFVESSSRLVELGDGAKCHLVIIRDITERKLAEEALRKSESLYRLLADNVTDVIWAMDLHLNFTYVSPSVTAMQGYTVDEMATKDLQEILTPDSFELVTGILAEELATESTEGKDLSRSRTLELEIQCKDGSSIWAEVKMSFIRDQNGQPVSIIGVTRDITERKRAQDALRESEEKFRSLAESAPNVILTVTADGTILFINRTVEGITREEAISKTVYDFVKPAYHSTMRRAMEQVIRTGQPTIYEVIGLGPEGRESWYETHVGPIKRDGHVVALIFINTDITERVRQQEQILQHNKELAALNAIAQTVSQSLDLNEILNNALDKIGEILSIKNTLVALMDENGGLLTIRVERGMNRARIPQWRIGEGVLGHVAQIGEPMFIDSIPDASGLMREDHVKAATSYHVRSIMYVPLKAKGRTLGVLMAATQADRVLAPEERNLLITIGHQVSTAIENAMLYRELQQKEEMRRDGLRQAILAQEEERRRIARELHDQTSQVLTGASAMIEASVAALPQEYAEVKERLQLARLSLTHMLIDVRNIIYELRPTMLDDLGLVAAARWHAEGFLGKASIRAHFQTKGRKRKLPAPVETAIFRIIQEAATNIVRHAKARSAEIQLEYRKHSLGLSIKDDGKGFAIERIMHPKQGKRGLGLLSMKERVEILGGCFVIESHPDTGTLITIEIPT